MMRSTPEPDENMHIIPPIYDQENDPYGPEGLLYLDIDYFSKFMEKAESRLLSKPVIVRGIPWRILAICRGQVRGGMNNQRKVHSLGFFLQCNNEDVMPKRGMWRCSGTATLEVINVNGGDNMSKRINHTFHNNEVDWGFTNFDSYETLANPENGFIMNDTVRLKCYFTADVPTGNGYHWDSKLHTGCIGLRNQGATCYMNSILQAFYFTTGFRKAVYQMETGNEPSESNICLAMQRVFYELQMSNDAVETNSLTRAFGWDKLDAFNQHDVQEFCRVLLDNLETKMKGTSQEQSIPKLFRGNMKSFIKCTDVQYESSRTESFYDVQLNVLGMESLERAFEAYTTTEMLDGDNKYDAGDYGLQRAEKGVKFVELPPILHVQLMRFQYCGVEQKVNEKFTFPEEIDLENCCELSDKLSKEDCIYNLHAVLVHSGEFHGGHYVTFINTNLYETNNSSDVKPRWCKFDDDVVSRTTVDDAISSNFGGERSMNTSAYMLIYVRKNSISDVLAPIPNSDIPQNVSQTFENERQQRNRLKEKKEAESMCMEIPIIMPSIIAGHHGFDIIDCNVVQEVTHESVRKCTTINQLYRLIDKRICSNGDAMDENEFMDDDDYDGYCRKNFRFRLWKMSETYYKDKDTIRSTSRFRPDTYLDPMSKDTMEKIFNSEVDAIYVEMPSNFFETLPPFNVQDDVFVFVKFYDPSCETFTMLGHTIVNNRRPIEVYNDILCKMAELPPGTKLNYYEEVSPNIVRLLDKTDEIAYGHMFTEEDGAIVIIEQAEVCSADNNAKVQMDEMYKTTHIEFHENLLNKKPDEETNEPFVKKVQLDSKLSVVAEKIGKELSVDPRRILFWSKTSNGRTEMCVENYSIVDAKKLTGKGLHDPRMCKRYRATYSILPFAVSEMERRQQMKIFAMDDKMDVEEMTIFPIRDGTVANILEEAKRYFNYAPNGTGKLRLLQIGMNPNYSRVHQIYPESLSINEIEQKLLYKCRVEEVPHDELEIGPGEFFCPVVHFDRDPTNRQFGTSFVIKVKNGELMKDVRDRLRKKLSDVPDSEFSKYKFALLSRDKICRYIEFGQTEKVNLQDMTTQTTGNIPQVYIGIDHKSPVSHSNENAIRILN